MYKLSAFHGCRKFFPINFTFTRFHFEKKTLPFTTNQVMFHQQTQVVSSLTTLSWDVIFHIFTFGIAHLQDAIILLQVNKRWDIGLVSRAVRACNFLVHLGDAVCLNPEFCHVFLLFSDWLRIPLMWKNAFRSIDIAGTTKKIRLVLDEIISNDRQMILTNVDVYEPQCELDFAHLRTRELTLSNINPSYHVSLHPDVEVLRCSSMSLQSLTCSPNVNNFAWTTYNKLRVCDHSFRLHRLLPNLKEMTLSCVDANAITCLEGCRSLHTLTILVESEATAVLMGVLSQRYGILSRVRTFSCSPFVFHAFRDALSAQVKEIRLPHGFITRMFTGLPKICALDFQKFKLLERLFIEHKTDEFMSQIFTVCPCVTVEFPGE
jgi:hypothetical protein